MIGPRNTKEVIFKINGENKNKALAIDAKVRKGLIKDGRFSSVQSEKAADSWPIYGISKDEFHGLGINAEYFGEDLWIMVRFNFDDRPSHVAKDIRNLITEIVGKEDMRGVKVDTISYPYFPDWGDGAH